MINAHAKEMSALAKKKKNENKKPKVDEKNSF